MATTYAFQISMPLSSTLPRDRISNTVHLEHVVGGLLDTDLEGMCQDIVAMYQFHYGNAAKEIQCKAYDVDAVPNYPRADVVVNPGVIWTTTMPHEICLCLSYCADHRGNKQERGRIYLQPALVGALSVTSERPSQGVMDWALAFYTTSNNSFPDLGGVDWKFGVWSRTYKDFTQSKQAWVNDEWDVQRRRGLRETTRVTATREG
jgi:hypothetical protein